MIAPIAPFIKAGFVASVENHRFGQNLEQTINEQGQNPSTGEFIANWFCLQAGFMYAEKEHPFVKYILETSYGWGQRPFTNEDGTNNGFVIDNKLMRCACSWGGFAYRDRDQYSQEKDMLIYDSSVFATRKSKSKRTVAIHWFDQSWVSGGFLFRIKRFIKKYLYFIYRTQ